MTNFVSPSNVTYTWTTEGPRVSILQLSLQKIDAKDVFFFHLSGFNSHKRCSTEEENAAHPTMNKDLEGAQNRVNPRKWNAKRICIAGKSFAN